MMRIAKFVVIIRRNELCASEADKFISAHPTLMSAKRSTRACVSTQLKPKNY